MRKLLIVLAVMMSTVSAYAGGFSMGFNREPDVKKGADYAFMQDNAKMWLYLDFTKAELVFFSSDKKQRVKETRGLYLAQKTEEEWAEDFEAIYFWIIQYWNIACDKRNIPLHMTADKDEAKYAMELYIDTIDYGFPPTIVAGQGATIDGTLLVRDLQSGETVYEADINKIQTVNWYPPLEVGRIRATIYGAILGPHFLGMDPAHMDPRMGDKAALMKYNKDYKPKKKKNKK